MIAKGKWVLATHLKQDKMKSGIHNPSGEHKYFMEVLSVGDEVTSCEKGDVIHPASTLGWSQINGEKIYILQGGQVAAVVEEDDLTGDDGKQGSNLDLIKK